MTHSFRKHIYLASTGPAGRLKRWRTFANRKMRRANRILLRKDFYDADDVPVVYKKLREVSNVDRFPTDGLAWYCASDWREYVIGTHSYIAHCINTGQHYIYYVHGEAADLGSPEELKNLTDEQIEQFTKQRLCDRSRNIWMTQRGWWRR